MSIGPTDSYALGSTDIIGAAWRTAWAPPDRRQIFDWGRDSVNLQGDYVNKGPFSIDDTRHLELPFRYALNDQVRMINLLKAIQTFGSGIGDIFLQHVFAEAPGPFMATLQTDDDAEQHYLTRIKPTFEASPIERVRALHARLHKKRDLYQWPHMNAYFQGANINSLQRKSIQYELNDEVWCWEPGMLAEAWGRTEAFKRVCKIFNISQGGIVDSDWDVAWNNGRRHDWGCHCQSCGHLQPLDFFATMIDNPKERAGIIWSDDSRRADETWDYDRAAATTRFRCAKCGAEHEDHPRTWEAFNRTGEYLIRDPDRSIKDVSLRWTSLVRGPWSDLTVEFLKALAVQKQGVTAPLEQFYQKKLALHWDPSMAVQKVVLSTSEYLKENPLTRGYKHATIAHEKIRFITADYQQGNGNEGRHFWVQCRAWRAKGKGSRLLWEGRVKTPENIRELQLALGVIDSATCIDGSFEMMEVASFCARYGWTMLCGDDPETFLHPAPKGKRNAKPKRRPFSVRRWVDPHKGKSAQGKTGCWCFYWSNPTIKNITFRLRHGHGAPWELPADLSAEYKDQIDSEAKRRFLNKQTGAVDYKWVKYKADNHHWDGECMQTTCALIAELIDFDFDELDAAVRAKGSFESTAPEISNDQNPKPAPSDVAKLATHKGSSATLAPHDQPEQLILLST